MESIKKLLKTDEFKEISSNNEILKVIRLYLIKMIGDKQPILSIRNNLLFVKFSKNSFASKFKLLKKEILKELNTVQNKITFENIFTKVDPSIIKAETKLSHNKKISRKAEKIWANFHKSLNDSPLKDYFSKKND